jgi:hypothetical protein
MTGLLLISAATITLGVAIMWLGTILQMSENPPIASDARILLGAGMGVMLAGCGFGLAVGVLYPDVVLEAKRQAAMVALEHAHVIATATVPKGI